VTYTHSQTINLRKSSGDARAYVAKTGSDHFYFFARRPHFIYHPLQSVGAACAHSAKGNTKRAMRPHQRRVFTQCLPPFISFPVSFCLKNTGTSWGISRDCRLQLGAFDSTATGAQRYKTMRERILAAIF